MADERLAHAREARPERLAEIVTGGALYFHA
jgi:hypothetical protein